MPNNDFLMQEDLKYLWHPCTQMKDHETHPIIPIKKAKGVYLYDYDGNAYIDGISSWWVNILGHSNPSINKALKAQVERLEHVIFAGFTHEPAIALAKKLVEVSPNGLNRVFYADNGSSGIEVALKMCFHYFKNRNQTRAMFLSLQNSYHGETMGALAVSDMGIYKEAYNEILLKSTQVYSPKNTSQEETTKALEALEAILQEKHSQISALIIEPLVLCAGLMQMYSPEYLKGARELTKQYGVLMIADEVAVGFGRTGTLFACEQAGISADFMVLSKGLTGGYLPLSAVLTTDEIYEAFYCDYDPVRTFLHSHSYTANPLACSVALASLEYLESKNIIQKNQSKIKKMAKLLKKFEALECVENIRQTGMICAITLRDFEGKRLGLSLASYARSKGVLIRPLGNVVYFMPPYIITHKQLEYLFDVVYNGVLDTICDQKNLGEQ